MPKTVATDPASDDPRLRGREYTLPFSRVWEAVLEVAGARRGWTVLSADARAGKVAAEARTLVWRFVDDVEITVALDAMGLTRVDVRSASRVGRGDFGTNARRIARFLRLLDRKLMRQPPASLPVR